MFFCLPVLIYPLIKLAVTHRFNCLYRLDSWRYIKSPFFKVMNGCQLINHINSSFEEDSLLAENFSSSPDILAAIVEKHYDDPRIRDVMRRLHELEGIDQDKVLRNSFLDILVQRHLIDKERDIQARFFADIPEEFIAAQRMLWTDLLLGKSHNIMALITNLEHRHIGINLYFQLAG